MQQSPGWRPVHSLSVSVRHACVTHEIFSQTDQHLKTQPMEFFLLQYLEWPLGG